MKKILIITICLLMSAFGGDICFAELHPVEGSTNYLETDDSSDGSSCVDLQFLFARGSGAEYQKSEIWLKFEEAMMNFAARRNYSAQAVDIAYPAVSVTEPFKNALGAFVSAGEYYTFGKSVRKGVTWTQNYYQEVAKSCPDTLWVVSGYSQGAMVAAEAVKTFQADKVVYVALFADPKLYLPEGEGLFPAACSGKNLSEYRIYVPNCRTREGRLKARSPYIYGDLAGKYGLWCAKNDYICGSTQLPWGIDGHLHYDERIPQLVGILRKLLPYRGSGSVQPMSVRLTTSSSVYALLALDEYNVRSGEDVIVDASDSFSLDAEIVDYAWSVDGGEFYSTGVTPQITLNFPAEGEHTVRVRVTDWLDSEAEYESRIVVSDADWTQSFNEPTEVAAHRDGDSLVLNWGSAPTGAKWLWTRLNGFDLGYVAATQGELTVQDIDWAEENYVEVAWSDDENIGAWGEIALSDLYTSVVSDNVTIDDDAGTSATSDEAVATDDKSGVQDGLAPHTGVTLADGMLPCLIMLGCVIGVRKILWA